MEPLLWRPLPLPLRPPRSRVGREYAFGPRPDEQPLHRINGDAQGCCYENEPRPLSVRAEISILPAAHKGSPTSQAVECG